jgi:hypothetical protein
MSLEEKGLPSFADFVICGIFTSTKVTEYREEVVLCVAQIDG